MPAMTGAFDDEPLPFERAAPPLPPLLRCALAPELRDDAPELRDDALRAPGDAALPRDEELPLREDADGDRRLDALPLFCLLEDEPRPLLLDEFPPFFGLDPFELRELVCFLLPERDLAWAITPP